jgi:hypothetical protein
MVVAEGLRQVVVVVVGGKLVVSGYIDVDVVVEVEDSYKGNYSAYVFSCA